MSFNHEIYTPEEVSKILKIGMTQVYKLLHSGSLKHLRIGKLIRVPDIYLQEYISNANGGYSNDNWSKD